MKVREQAATTLVEMYRHVGERFRVDISKKDISTAKYDVVLTVVTTDIVAACLHCRWAQTTQHVSVEVRHVSVSPYYTCVEFIFVDECFQFLLLDDKVKYSWLAS